MEPSLIRWVHLVKFTSFINAYQHLSKQPLSLTKCDRCVNEMNKIGHLLGAVELPDSWQSTQAELSKFQSELCFDERAKKIIEVIENYPVDFIDKPFMHLVLSAAFDVMPVWALDKIERRPVCSTQILLTKSTLVVASEPIQWMLNRQGVCAISRERVLGASFN